MVDACMHGAFVRIIGLWIRFGSCILHQILYTDHLSTSGRHPSGIDQILLLLSLPVGFCISILLLRIVPRILISLAPFALTRSLVKLVQDLLRDPVQELLGVNPQQTPSEVDGLVNGSRLVRGLRDERLFELLEEFEGELVFRRQSFLTDYGFHGRWEESEC